MTAVDRLRSCLHVHPHVGAVCTVRDSDLRDVLSLVESMRACCEDRGKALDVTIQRGVPVTHAPKVTV